jgi:hypothetical protein
MAAKTMIRQVVKLLPLSSEWRDRLEAATADVADPAERAKDVTGTGDVTGLGEMSDAVRKAAEEDGDASDVEIVDDNAKDKPAEDKPAFLASPQLQELQFLCEANGVDFGAFVAKAKINVESPEACAKAVSQFDNIRKIIKL